jgi:putative phosphoribosyl transferase
VAAPVASPGAFEKMQLAADDAVVLVVDPGFAAVGQYYEKFAQTTDDEVVVLLNRAAKQM